MGSNQQVAVAAKISGGVSSFSDNFNRSDRALDGDNGWAFIEGTLGFSIVSNELDIGPAVGGRSQVNSGWSFAAGYVQVDVKLQVANATVGIIFREQDSNNFYLIDIDVAGGGTLAHYSLYKRVAGTYTLLGNADGTQSWTVGTYATFKVTFSSSNYAVFLNGVSDFTTTDSTFTTAGLTGLRAGGGTINGRAADNFTASQ